MENQFTHRVFRLFPSSFGSCRFGIVSDVIENSIKIPTNHQIVHHIEPLSSSNHSYPSTSKLKRPQMVKNDRLLKNTDTEGRTCLPVKPISSVNSNNKERAKQSIIKNSSSSNGGWFSSEEQGEVDGETDTFFSVSWDSTSDSFRRNTSSSRRKTTKTRRRRGNSKSSEMIRCPFEVSASSTDTFSDFGSFRRKTTETRPKPTKDRRRTQMGRHYPVVTERKVQESSEVTASSSDSYGDFGSFHHNPTKTRQKTAKTSRKTGETSRRTQMACCQFVSESEVQESLEISSSSTEFYGDFGSISRKTGKTSRRRGVDGSSEIGRCPVVVDGRVEESYAMEKISSDPYSDFRTSMVEMIVEKQIFGGEDLESLLQCFLSLNSAHHHKLIIQVFSEICEALFTH